MNFFLLYFINSDKTLRQRPRPTPCKEAPGGGVCSSIKTMALEGETALSWWGCLCACVKLATKSFRAGVFVPAKTDLGVFQAVKK
jgi:hypothetical protein